LRWSLRQKCEEWGYSVIEADAGETALHLAQRGTSLEELEHSMVELAMSQANGNRTNAAKLLDISRDTLRYKLKKFSMAPAEDEI
jgi:transcriptional regulator with PAS, ATPase and Fis domain